ncbi:MAG TPA: methylenetetrahydrofolate reductase [Acidobacteriota bacterium]|nr:methylenetetrahydrofolate reductase [Acidobacteriota bacterium]
MALIAILNKFREQNQPIFTVEISPPVHFNGILKTWETLDILKDLDLQGLAVTNNTGGSFKLNPLSIAREIRQFIPQMPIIVHLTARDEGSARSLYTNLANMEKHNISDLLVIRGDPTPGASKQVDSYRYFTYELVRLTSEYRDGKLQDGSETGRKTALDILIAGHPEFPDSQLAKHFAFQKRKMEFGANGIICNIVNDPVRYSIYMDAARHAGIDMPMIPSVIPLNSFKRVEFLEERIHVSVPTHIRSRLEALPKEEAFHFAVQQATLIAEELLDRGAPGINFNVIFKRDAEAVREVLRNLRGYATLWEKYDLEPGDEDYFEILRNRGY